MLKLDNNLLQELGLGGLPDDQKKSMLQHIYETLELRVGTQLANQMTDQQLAEFERFIDAGGDNNQTEALKWLETNLPNYKQVVNDVFEALKAEIKQMAPQIMSTVPQQQAPAAQQQPQMPPQQPMQPQAPQQPASSQEQWQQPQSMPQQQYQQPQPGQAQQQYPQQPQQWQQPPQQ